MSAVLFGQAYYLRFDPKLWAAMQPYPPLGTLYAAAALREAGHAVALFDAMLAASESEWEAALDVHRPRYAVLFEDNFNYLSKMCLSRMREAALVMTRAAAARGATVIVCGADATDHPDVYLDAGARFVILGEGEATLVALMASLEGRSDAPPSSIAGLAHRGEGGLVHLGARRPVLKALDALPFPAWDLIDARRYAEIWRARHGRYSINMVTTRGCPYHCNWCAKPIWGQRYNVRSAASVVEELAMLRARLGVEHVWFADDIFGLQPGWIARFADEVNARGVKTPFKALSRADLLLRDGEIDALAQAGCETVWIGAESGSQKILDAMDKGTTVAQIHAAARGLRARGVRSGFFLQFGYPGETLDDIEMTFEMVREAMPDEIGISVSYPMPGTKFYEAVRSQLGAKRNWVDSADLSMMYEGPFTTAFYRKLHRVMHKEHQARLALRELGAVARSPWTLRRGHVRRGAGLLLRAATRAVDREELLRLARPSERAIGALSGRLSHDDAAAPSPQD